MTNPKAVLFDLDCTLTDRARSLERFAPVFVEHFGRRLARPDAGRFLSAICQVDDLGYAPRSVCWEHLLRELEWRDPPSHRELDWFWKDRSPNCAVANEAAEEVLRALSDRGYALGIITNGPVANQEGKIHALGLSKWMKAVVVSQAVGLEKPDPAIFHLACRRLEVAPEEAWHVGDHPQNDVIGARRAGLGEVWVRVGRVWTWEDPPPERQLNCLADLPELLP